MSTSKVRSPLASHVSAWALSLLTSRRTADSSVSATASGTSRRALLADDENAWTAPSSPAHIVLAFPEPIAAQRLALTFQGGFAATTIGVTATVDGEETSLGKVYPEDVNRRQVFECVSRLVG